MLLPSYSFRHCSFFQYGLKIVFDTKDNLTPCCIESLKMTYKQLLKDTSFYF